MIPVIAFINGKGRVGTTTLVYHLAWKLADMGYGVLAADLDPQANLTAAFLDEDDLESLWTERRPDEARTISDSLRPLIEGTGGLASATARAIDSLLYLAPGDLALAWFEDALAACWPKCAGSRDSAQNITSAFWRILQSAASRCGARVILMDLGPNLGAINRAALIAADSIVVPLAPDVGSVEGLRNLGPAIREWRGEWKSFLERNPGPALELPQGKLRPEGYVLLRHPVRLDRPVQAYGKWLARLPLEYSKWISANGAGQDRIASLRYSPSLLQMAKEARKPVFHLKPADGALGAHLTAANAAGEEYAQLARELMRRVNVE